MEHPWRRPLSQHFLRDRTLVQRLVRASSLSPHDLVVEVGPGRGIITQELLNTARSVIAVEVDERLCRRLRQRLGHEPRLSLVRGDFLAFRLPSPPYKVFANLPFAITGEVIRKLLQAEHPPADCYLVVQREAALKFMPRPARNPLAALLYYPWWDIRIVHRFRRADFDPPPRVDSVLLRLEQRAAPLLDTRQKALYHDYAAYTIGRDPAAQGLSALDFVASFERFLHRASSGRLRAIHGAFGRLCAQQRKLHKIHRTRTDPNWKSARSAG
jgi:23S rRNA (adenine-N6)-dimethyltransferase